MTSQRWRLLAFAAAVVTSALAATAALVSTSSCTVTTTGLSTCTASRASLLASEGAGVLAVLAVPVLVTLVPVLVRSRVSTVLAAVALSLGVLLALASIGILFAPTLVLAWLAARAALAEAAGPTRA